MEKEARVVIVAGGSGTIGGAIAEEFARQGETVIVWGLNKERLHAIAKSEDGNIRSEHVDATDPTEVKKAVEKVAQEHGRIDVIVNAVGNLKPVTTTMSYEDAIKAWNEMIAVNLTSSFLITEAAVPHLTQPGGRIVFTGSISAYTGSGRPGGMGYAAAKAGLSGLIFALAKELGPQGVTVNAVVPGLVPDTGITSQYPSEAVQGYIDQTPVRRGGTPKDIASAVAYLASPEAEFVTGQFLHVN